MPDGTRAGVENLTPWGMVLLTRHALQPGDALALELRPPGAAIAFTASGVVERVAGAGKRRAHVRFTELRMHEAR
jgi:hypothetical protein